MKRETDSEYNIIKTHDFPQCWPGQYTMIQYIQYLVAIYGLATVQLNT